MAMSEVTTAPHPFTKCVDYGRGGACHSSRAHCRNACWQRNYNASGLLTWAELHVRTILRNKCLSAETCKQGCVETWVDAIERVENFDDADRVAISGVPEAHLRLISSPTIGMQDLLLLLAGIGGVWLGVSVMCAADAMLETAARLFAAIGARTRKLVTRIYWPIFVIILIAQLLSLLAYYNSYTMATAIEAGRSDIVTPPAISLCFEMPKTPLHDAIASMNITSYIEEIVVIDSASTEWRKFQGVSLAALLALSETFIKRDKLCVVLQTNYTINYNTQAMMQVLDEMVYLNITLADAQHGHPKFSYMLHPRDSLPFTEDVSGDLQRCAFYNSRRSAFAILRTCKLTTYSSALLPHPYASRCMNYATTPWKSQLHCFDSCIKQMLRLHCYATPYDMIITELHQPSLLQDRDATLETSHPRLAQMCAQRCARLDCAQISLAVHLMRELRTRTGPARTFLQTLNMVEYRTTHLPQMQLVQFAIYAGSYVGIWLGFDLLAIQFLVKLGAKLTNAAWRRYHYHVHHAHSVTMVVPL